MSLPLASLNAITEMFFLNPALVCQWSVTQSHAGHYKTKHTEDQTLRVQYIHIKHALNIIMCTFGFKTEKQNNNNDKTNKQTNNPVKITQCGIIKIFACIDTDTNTSISDRLSAVTNTE